MTNPWKPTNRMTDDTVMHDAIGKIREASDKRREVEAHVLAENNLASVRQLSEDKKKKFCAIVDALLAEQEIDVQLFPENDQALIDAASQIKTTTWGTITEGAEGLQELSSGTLQSYKKKARTDVGQRVLRAHDQAQTNWKAASVDKRKVAKRVVGIHNASARLNKEEVVDESLYGTVQKVKKAFSNRNGWTALGRAANEKFKSDHAYDAHKAAAGIKRSEGGDKIRGNLMKKAEHHAKGYQRYLNVADGAKGIGKPMKFGTRKEEIMEAILEMEGLRIEQLTESGLDKLNAIAEQVMIDEGVELEEGAIGDIIRSHVRPIKQKWDAQSKELKRRSVHAFSKPGSWEHTFSHPNAMNNPGHDPEKHNYDGKSFTHHVHLHDTKGDAGNVSKFKVVARNDKDAVEAAKYDHSEFSDAHPHELKVVHIHHVMHEDLDEDEKKNLDELSKATLSRYIVKAHTSGTAAAADQENAFMRGAKRNKDRLRKAGQTGERREQGIQRAAHQLSYKKEEVVDEGLISRITNAAKRLNKATQTTRDRIASSEKRISKRPDSKAKSKALDHVDNTRRWINDTGEEPGAGMQHIKNHGFGYKKKVYGKDQSDKAFARNLKKESYEPRGERDVGDKKNPTGVPNKKVDQATLIARKQAKLKGDRKVPQEAW